MRRAGFSLALLLFPLDDTSTPFAPLKCWVWRVAGYPKSLLPTHSQLVPAALPDLRYAATSTQGISSQEWLGKSMQMGLSGIAIASIQQIAYPETYWLFLKDCFVF